MHETCAHSMSMDKKSTYIHETIQYLHLPISTPAFWLLPQLHRTRLTYPHTWLFNLMFYDSLLKYLPRIEPLATWFNQGLVGLQKYTSEHNNFCTPNNFQVETRIWSMWVCLPLVQERACWHVLSMYIVWLPTQLHTVNSYPVQRQ